MTSRHVLDELTEAIWSHVEQCIARHGRDATSEALVAILGRVLALHRVDGDSSEP